MKISQIPTDILGMNDDEVRNEMVAYSTRMIDRMSPIERKLNLCEASARELGELRENLQKEAAARQKDPAQQGIVDAHGQAASQ